MSDEVVDLSTVGDEVLADLLRVAGVTLSGPSTRERMITALVAVGIADVVEAEDAYDPSFLTPHERRAIARANGEEWSRTTNLGQPGSVYRQGVGLSSVADQQVVTDENGRPKVWREP